MIESSMIINDKMPEYTVDRAASVLNKYKKALNGSKILVLGVAYKNNIDDCRESPALNVIDILKERGAETDFYDPWIPKYKRNGKWHEGIGEINADIIKGYDLILVATAHDAYDYEMIRKNAVAIFDTRNAFKDVEERDNISLL